ncbi:unnamed protein product [Lampetra fluviatilis]
MDEFTGSRYETRGTGHARTPDDHGGQHQRATQTHQRPMLHVHSSIKRPIARKVGETPTDFQTHRFGIE